VRVSVTFAITLAIFHFIENPVRMGKLWKGRTFAVSCALLAVAGLGFAAMNTHAKVQLLVDPDAVVAQQRALDDLPAFEPDSPTRSVVDPSLPARVLVVGDSQSWAIGSRMKTMWGEPNGVRIEPSPGVGCGISPLTPIKYLGIHYNDGYPGCKEWRAALPAIVAKFHPQLVMIVGGLGDISDRKLPGSNEWQHIGQPAYDQWLRQGMESFVDEMTASGAKVLWMTHPDVRPPRPAGTKPFVEEDPARMDRYNALIHDVADADPRVEYADLATFVKQRPGGEFDPIFRPDGAHFDLSVAPDFVDWIGAQIRAAGA
jgi:hypothetical protein